jgi:hypothetical protein
VAKYNNDHHQIWHDSMVSFKTKLIKSLGLTLEGTIAPPPDGFKLKSVRQIVDAVAAKYGTVDQMALAKMEEVLATPLDHVYNLDKHLASLRQHMLMQIAAGYPIEEYRKVRLFRLSVAGHYQIAQCLRDFDKDYPDQLSVTYHDITSYVVKHLPNIRAAAGIENATPVGIRAHMAATTSGEGQEHTTMTLPELQVAYSAMLQKLKNNDSQKRRNRGGDNKDKKRPKSNTPSKTGQTAQPDKCKHYCYAHGSQNSHTFAQCKVMANQPENFTPEMRRATNAHSPHGGSTLVKGQEN